MLDPRATLYSEWHAGQHTIPQKKILIMHSNSMEYCHVLAYAKMILEAFMAFLDSNILSKDFLPPTSVVKVKELFPYMYVSVYYHCHSSTIWQKFWLGHLIPPIFKPTHHRGWSGELAAVPHSVFSGDHNLLACDNIFGCNCWYYPY